jgi:hypothetical protein
VSLDLHEGETLALIGVSGRWDKRDDAVRHGSDTETEWRDRGWECGERNRKGRSRP